MKFLRPLLFLPLGSIVFLFPGCDGGNKNAANQPSANVAINSAENSNSAKTNVEELAVFVNVPYQAEDIVWKQDAKTKKVIAVLRFSPEDSNKVVSGAEKFGAAQGVSIETDVWFPDELTAQSDMSGDNALKGTAYPANEFFQEPYSAGRITRIENTDYFVLELAAKN